MSKENKLKLEDVEVELVKEGNLIVLKVKGECEINLNEETIYTPQEKKEYRLLPQNLVPFISKYQEYINDENDQFDIDLCIDGKTITIYVPKNKNKKTFVARFDTSIDDALTQINDEYEISEDELKEFKTTYEEMNATLKELGYKLKYSHSQNEFIWCWSDIAFNIKDFNEDEFLTVCKAMIAHDKAIMNLYNKLG